MASFAASELFRLTFSNSVSVNSLVMIDFGACFVYLFGLGLLYMYIYVIFDFFYILSSSQEIGWEERLQNVLICVVEP